MINDMSGMNIASLVSLHRSMFYARILLDALLNRYAERWWGIKAVSKLKMGYEIFSSCAKLSSALVPTVKSDRSLTVQIDISLGSHIAGHLLLVK